MAFDRHQGTRRIVYDETPKDFVPRFEPPIADVDMSDFRYRGYLNSITYEDPRKPLTGPVEFRGEHKKYPLKSTLIKGRPVLPPNPAKGFIHGSPAVGNYTEEERKENRVSLKLQQKSSADRQKFYKQQEDRLRFMSEYQKHKADKERQRRLEKEEDLQLLGKYNPFGKPGFGAPRGLGGKHAKITNSLDSKDGVGIVRVEQVKPSSEGNVKASNKPKIRRYEDDRMRRYRVDKDTAEQYKKELDALIDVKEHNKQIIRKLDKKREDGMWDYDPFGKPGAGAPNRDEQGRIKMSRKYQFGSPEKFTPTDEDNAINPWLKLGNQPRRNKLHLPRAGDHGIYEFVDPNSESEILPRRHVGGGGEPLVGDRGEKMTKRVGLLQTIHGARRTENITKVATPEEVRAKFAGKSPWGRPGAGAPLKDIEGAIVKNTKGTIQHEALGYSKSEEETIGRAKKLYRDELKDGIERQKQIRDEEKSYLRLPPGDVPSWFSKGKVGRPKRDPVTGIIVPQKRIMSDVTAQKFNVDRPRDAETYYQNLQKMAEDRYKKRMEERQRIIEQELKVESLPVTKGDFRRVNWLARSQLFKQTSGEKFLAFQRLCKDVSQDSILNAKSADRRKGFITEYKDSYIRQKPALMSETLAWRIKPFPYKVVAPWAIDA